MSQTYTDADGLVHFRDDTRETIIKSGLSGVAATVLAITIWSPAGLGGMVGTSVAAGHAPDSSAAADAVASLAAYPVPLTTIELADIRARLSDSEASLEASRSLTDGDIQHIRSIAARANVANIEPMAMRGRVGSGMAVTEAPAVRVQAAAPVVIAPAVEAALLPVSVPVRYDPPSAQLGSSAAEVTYSSGANEEEVRDPNMELAELLLAR